MKYSKTSFLLPIFFFLFMGPNLASGTVNPPVAKKVPHILVEHQHSRVDPFYWLRERENPEVISYLKAENDYTDKKMEHTLPLQKNLIEEMKARIQEDEVSAPYLSKGYYYYSKFSKGQEYPKYYRIRDSGGSKARPEEELLLDVNELAKGHEYCSVVGLSVSEDQKILSFGVDFVGRRQYTIRFKDLTTGKMLEDQISSEFGTEGEMVWANDNRTVFYPIKDETLRTHKIMRHQLGNPQEEDVVVFHEEDETFSVGVGKSKSDKYIIVSSWSTLSSEMSYLEADRPAGTLKMFYPRQKDLEYSIDHQGDRFYILTNDKAKNFRVMEALEGHTSLADWKEVVPHREDVLVMDMEVTKNFVALQERKDGLPQIHVMELSGGRKGKDYHLNFPEATYDAYFKDNFEYETNLLRYGFTSLNTPASTYDLDMAVNERKLVHRKEVRGGFNPENYQTERLWARARDGVLVPISLVYKKSLKKIGTPQGQPLLLYAYGSYGYSTDPYFDMNKISLLDRGFVYALAHVRGGQEMGRSWYEDGKLLKKKNTFYDFIDCARHLVEQKYTHPQWLFGEGASAGGLLMGAVVNMAPELFRGIIAGVPFVDVVTTMLDETIPLTTSEYDEWGNPNDKTFYDYMLSYSPYDNVIPRHYPSLLVTSGFHDSQVQYWEPTKWVAKLRLNKLDKNPLLLKTNMEAGHSGRTGRYKQLEEEAFQFAFYLDQISVKK